MSEDKCTFALFFGNRVFFPASHQEDAREEIPRVLKSLGHDVIMMPEDATQHGAVETPQEGEKYARFLADHRGEFQGVILSLPNFGDETGAIAALKDAGVPILIQAYPDDLNNLGPDSRRDSFCGKFSVMDVFKQHGLKFTALKPHVVSPSSDAFKANVAYFNTVCRIVDGMRRFVVGAIGARTTAFKTVRIDELALEKHGITVETLDLSRVITSIRNGSTNSAAYKAKAEKLRGLSRWGETPEAAFENIVKLGVVIDEIFDEFNLDSMGLRCWTELQEELGISPCLIMGELNDRRLSAACEVDVGSAVAMHALQLAAGGPAACLDWNNNYGDAENKCILFHCGPVPPSMMDGLGEIVDHAIMATTMGPGRSYGPNAGRIAPMDITFSNMMTTDGQLQFYLGEGRITEDKIENPFFGVAGVAELDRMEDVFMHIGKTGHRHHVNIAQGHHVEPLFEALSHYLAFDVAIPQEMEAVR
jgi:L-fucose isomerase-like protein